MKKLLLLFLLISGLCFSQEKKLFTSVSYADLISFFNTSNNIKNESLEDNIKRCIKIITENNDLNHYDTYLLYNFYLQALTEAKNHDKNSAYVTVYKVQDNYYEFYNSKNEFVERAQDIDFDQGNKSIKNVLNSYWYILQ